VPAELNRDLSSFPALRLAAMLKAASDFGLDQPTLNGIALRYDPRRPDLDWLAGKLTDALQERTLAVPDAV